MRQLRWFVVTVLLLLTLGSIALFVSDNSDSVRLDLPFLTAVYLETWLIVLASFFAGAFAASAGLIFQLGRKSLAARRFEKRVKGLEAEVEKLRAAAPAIAAGDGPPPAQRP
jgi:uncharacterized integral membrane protein